MALVTSESVVRDNLFSAGAQVAPVVAIHATIASGAVLKRGCPVGRASGADKLSKLSDAAVLPAGILAEDVDATGADAVAVVYASGEFNRDVVEAALEGTLTGAQILDLASVGIYCK